MFCRALPLCHASPRLRDALLLCHVDLFQTCRLLALLMPVATVLRFCRFLRLIRHTSRRRDARAINARLRPLPPMTVPRYFSCHALPAVLRHAMMSR